MSREEHNQRFAKALTAVIEGKFASPKQIALACGVLHSTGFVGRWASGRTKAGVGAYLAMCGLPGEAGRVMRSLTEVADGMVVQFDEALDELAKVREKIKDVMTLVVSPGKVHGTTGTGGRRVSVQQLASAVDRCGEAAELLRRIAAGLLEQVDTQGRRRPARRLVDVESDADESAAVEPD